MVRHHHQRNVRLIAVIAALTAATAVGAAPAGMPQPLTATPGDAHRGAAIALDANKGNCIICHAIPSPNVPQGAAGDLGPPLAGVGARLTAAELRARIVDPKRISPDTIMPGYYVTQGLTRVQAKYAGKTILSAQDIEDLVAFLETLK